MPLERNESDQRKNTKDAVEGTKSVAQHSVRDDIANHGKSAFGTADPYRNEDGKTTETPAAGDTAGKKKKNENRTPSDVTDVKFTLDPGAKIPRGVP